MHLGKGLMYHLLTRLPVLGTLGMMSMLAGPSAHRPGGMAIGPSALRTPALMTRPAPELQEMRSSNKTNDGWRSGHADRYESCFADCRQSAVRMPSSPAHTRTPKILLSRS